MKHLRPSCLVLVLAAVLGGCASTAPAGYGANARAPQPAPADDGVALTRANTRGTYLDLVHQMQQKGLWFASLAHIDALEKQWGVAPESTLLRADALRQTTQPQAAAALYTALLATPLAAAGHRGLGLVAAAGGDYAQAIVRFEQAQRQNPTDAALLSDLGYAYLKANRKSDARVPVMQAAQLEADNPRVVANLALYLLADGQSGRAEALMREQRVPEPMRAAILKEAAQLAAPVAGMAAAPTPALPSPSPSADAPLQLKAASWTALLDAQAVAANDN